MERTIILEDLDHTSATWLEQEAERLGLPVDQVVLEALQLGLAQLQKRQEEQVVADRIVQALLDTGLVHHLAVPLPEGIEATEERQEPPTLPGPLVSEIIIAQRRGEQ
jgi:hypothetical protein